MKVGGAAAGKLAQHVMPKSGSSTTAKKRPLGLKP